MERLFETITDLRTGRATLQRRRYGMIETRDGAFQNVRVRPFPKIASAPEAAFLGEWLHRHMPGDSFRLYYNQPKRFPNFLVAKYVVSTRHTSMASIFRAIDLFYAIAQWKGADALLCDASNWRISTAIMVRFGWEPHCPSHWHRHFIRRFYGNYPPLAEWIQQGLERAPELVTAEAIPL